MQHSYYFSINRSRKSARSNTTRIEVEANEDQSFRCTITLCGKDKGSSKAFFFFFFCRELVDKVICFRLLGFGVKPRRKLQI
jgi:hypothetical protein